MTEIEFLRRMFRRLEEAERFVSAAATSGLREASESHRAAVHGAIQDYLDTRGQQQQKGGST